MAWGGIALHGMARYGVAWNGTGLHCTGCTCMVLHFMSWCDIAWHGLAVLIVHTHCCWVSRFGVLPRRAITLFIWVKLITLSQVMITFIAVDFFELVDLEQYDLPLDILSLHPDKVFSSVPVKLGLESTKCIHSWMCAWLSSSLRRFLCLSLCTGKPQWHVIYMDNKFSTINIKYAFFSEWWSVCLRHSAHTGRYLKDNWWVVDSFFSSIFQYFLMNLSPLF